MLLLLLWQWTAIFKKKRQQPQEILEDSQLQHIALAAPVARDNHLQEEKTATTGTLRGYPGTAHCSCCSCGRDSHLQEEKTATTGILRRYPGTEHCSCCSVTEDSHLQEEKTATTGILRRYPGTSHCSCGRGQPSSRRENSNHRNSRGYPGTAYCSCGRGQPS